MALCRYSRRLDNSIYPSLWRYLFTFTPNIYWDIYKRIPSGKTLINNYHYQDNEGNIYALPTTDMYFNSTFASLNGGTGVYGIYSKGELIYIGYTANGYEGRWD